MSMKVLVTGVAGQLGHDVMNELSARGYEGTGTDLAPEYAGIQDGSPLRSCRICRWISRTVTVLSPVKETAPDVIVHCAAWTAVDLAEDEDKKEKVRAVNVDGTKNMADAAAQAGAKIVYLSTDYVFDGKGESVHGSRMTKTMRRSMYTDRPSSTGRRRLSWPRIVSLSCGSPGCSEETGRILSGRC